MRKDIRGEQFAAGGGRSMRHNTFLTHDRHIVSRVKYSYHIGRIAIYDGLWGFIIPDKY